MKPIVERLKDRTILRYHKQNKMETIVIYFESEPFPPFVWKDYRPTKEYKKRGKNNETS